VVEEQSHGDIIEERSRKKLWYSNSDSRNGYGQPNKQERPYKVYNDTTAEMRRRNYMGTQ
jgi:hypothetical protein